MGEWARDLVLIIRALSKGVPTGWRMESILLKHNEVGGVTDGHFRIEWAVQDGASDINFVFPP